MAVWMRVPFGSALMSALGSSGRCPLWPEADIDVMLAREGRVLAKGSSAHDDTCISPCLRLGTFFRLKCPAISLIGALVYDLASDHCKNWLDVFNFVRWDGEIVAI